MRLFPAAREAAKFAAARAFAGRRAHACFALLLCLLCASAGATLAQSGRRAPKNPSPLPQPTPDAAPSSSSTDAKPKTGDAKSTLYTFIVFEETDIGTSLPMNANRAVVKGFLDRLHESPDLSVRHGGRGDRRSAREAAKKETTTHTVVVQLAEDDFTRARTTTIDPSSLIVRYFVYAPQTATLKLQGSVYLRALQSSTRVGGIRLPLPSPGARGPYAFDSILEQAGRDAADRVMNNFRVRLPPDNR